MTIITDRSLLPSTSHAAACACSAHADVLVALQMITTMVTVAATTSSITEDTMVITLASSTAMVEEMLLLPLLLREEVQLLLQPLPLAGNC